MDIKNLKSHCCELLNETKTDDVYFDDEPFYDNYEEKTHEFIRGMNPR